MASGGPESAPTSSPQRTSSDHPRRPLIRTAAHPPHRNPAHPPHRNPAAPGDGFRIPCLVVWAERSASVAGFAYGTLPGHPERGEERFTLSLAPSGEVVFEIAAFSKPGRWFTRVGAPLGRLVQAWMTRRYLRAL